MTRLMLKLNITEHVSTKNKVKGENIKGYTSKVTKREEKK